MARENEMLRSNVAQFRDTVRDTVRAKRLRDAQRMPAH
jgi:hypothetical protein